MSASATVEEALKAIAKELRQQNALLREIGGILLTQSDAVRALAESESEEEDDAT